MKYPELKGKCKNCTLGCFRLEDINFTGIYRCDYYTEEGGKYEQVQKQKNNN